ncbi:hypothetical protein IY145_10830 [Methylosinus sp. H3A]|uniref:hypothetical protein n=1 Tax=Methylosinus sp. H3A TaxID=2785786 RepID=UPI0018C29DF6|nr:hypothetical protein [Methylosinus sp. H3A]MBG0809873.1 hypothetical protein [Methylosinus sp. H3A]
MSKNGEVAFSIANAIRATIESEQRRLGDRAREPEVLLAGIAGAIVTLEETCGPAFRVALIALLQGESEQ